MDKQPCSHLVVEVCTQRVLCTVRHPSQPMSRLWQEIASRWCQRSVCVVLTIDIYTKNNICCKTGYQLYSDTFPNG